jgi:hypothetical protein
VLVRRPHRWSSPLRRVLAAWFAALLAAAPFAHASLPADAAAGPAAIVDSLATQGGADAGAATIGLPARAAPLETALALVAKASELRATDGRPGPAPRTAAALTGADRPRLERSAVGTARTPTGPPA